MSDGKTRITTDLIVDAARVTRDVYMRNANKLGPDRPRPQLVEMRRVAIMDALASDEPLCEMLAGRIHQLGHGT